MNTPPQKSGFTLIELLTVIAIIGILAAILIPTVGKVRDSARAANCAANLRSYGNAFLIFSQENKGVFPWTGGTTNPNGGVNAAPATPVSTAGDFYNRWSSVLAIYAGKATLSADKMPDTYFCPSWRASPDYDPSIPGRWAAVGYGMVTRNYRSIRYSGRVSSPSRTVLVGETRTVPGVSQGYEISVTGSLDSPAWPSNGTQRENAHGNKANYLFADGHVESLESARALEAMARWAFSDERLAQPMVP